jgi:hypothetical protein
MTLRELAERFTRDYEFKVQDENEKHLGKMERNELVLLDYAVAKLEVTDYKLSEIYYNTVNVTVFRGEAF